MSRHRRKQRKRRKRSSANSDDDEDDDDESTDSNDDDSDERTKSSSCSSGRVYKVDDRTIFFYADVTRHSVTRLNILLHRLSTDLLRRSRRRNEEWCNDVITLHINSPGGELVYGMSAVDHIMTCVVKVNTIVDGEAGSAASLMSVAATGNATIMPNATMLIHQLSSGVLGKHCDIIDEASNCKLYTELMIQHYLRQCSSLDRRTLMSMLNNEKHINANEAVRLGFVDSVVSVNNWSYL
jgi:ATP-dependent protease ClpP protease subunit